MKDPLLLINPSLGVVVGVRCAAQPPYVQLVLHARRGVVDPASLVCGRARGDE